MIENKKVRAKAKTSEAGYGVIVVILVLFFFCVIVFTSLAASVRSSRSQENLDLRDDDKWQAKAAIATMRRVLQVRIPQKHEAHITDAQNCLRSSGIANSNLPVFDEQDASPQASVPVLLIDQRGTPSCNMQSGYSATLSYTSLLGNADAWAQSLLPVWEQDAYQYGYQPEMLKVARLAEQFRQYNSAGDPVYVFGFIIDARGGQHFRLRENGEVSLGDVSQNCGATGRLEITPTTVQRGNPVTFRITYTSVSKLRILNSSGALLHEENVVEQSDPQIFEWNYTPSATDSYRVEAISSDSGCFSRSNWIQVEVTEVPIPPCAIIDDLTATPDAVLSGEQSTIAWTTRNADQVTLDGTIVPANGSSVFTIVADRTFTLNARDAANNCPTTRQVTVRVNLAPCLNPIVTQFTVNPASATPGQSVTITWQIDNLMPGGVVNITLPDGTVLSNVGASGARNITAPAGTGTYNYSISAVNPCGTSANGTAQLQVNNACQIPSIGTYTASPSTVTAGGSQTVRLNWLISGNVDSINIAGIGNVSGNLIDIAQPQTTTDYLMTVTGCSTSVTRNVTVTVNPPSSGPSCNFGMDSDSLCSVLNNSQCGPHRVDGQITVSGNTFTFQQTHSPFGMFGNEFFMSNTFALADAANRQILTGAWAYNNAGSPYWISQPSGAGVLYQNGVTINGNLPAGVTLPLHATFDVAYGANTGGDTKSFDTRTSPGGCGSSGAGSCSSSYENEYYCDEHSNTRFTTAVDISITRNNGQTTVVITPPPNNKPGYYHAGFFTVSSSNGSQTFQFSSNPADQGNPSIIYYPEGGYIEKTFMSGTNYFVNGAMNFYLDPVGGACTIAGSQQIDITFEGDDSCIAGLYNVPEIMDSDKYNLFPRFLATLVPKAKSCSLY